MNGQGLERDRGGFRYRANGVELSASQTVQVDGAVPGVLLLDAAHHVAAEHDAHRAAWRDTYEHGSIRVVRMIRTLSGAAQGIQVSLELENRGGEPIRIGEVSLAVMADREALRLGGAPAPEWHFLRQPRYKNDLPSACVLGRKDGAYRDALRGLTEQGRPLRVEEQDLPNELSSDQLTVLSATAQGVPAPDTGLPAAPALLIGFPDGRDALVRTTVSLDDSAGELRHCRAVCLGDGAELAPGARRRFGPCVLLAGADGLGLIRAFATLSAERTGVPAGARPPAVYCTWYYYGATVTEADCLENLRSLRRRGVSYDVFQIDDGWSWRWGDWEANPKFPAGMRSMATAIRGYGVRPGLWTAPFVIDYNCELKNYHPEWILRTASGDPTRFPMGVDRLVLDVTHPGVLRWLEDLYARLTLEWGYTYHKLDFTRAVVVNPDVRFHDPAATRAEAYRRGLAAIRRGAGEEAYILVCGGLYGAAAGLADGQRTGSDVLAVWPQGAERPDAGESTEPLAPATIKQNALRFWMNESWDNDPDALMLRRRTTRFRALDLGLGLLTDTEALTATLNQYIGGGIVCFSDPVAEVDEDRLLLLRRVVPSLGRAAVPLDLLSGRRYPRAYVTVYHSGDAAAHGATDAWPSTAALDPPGRPVALPAGLGSWATVALVNWHDAPGRPAFELTEALTRAVDPQAQAWYLALQDGKGCYGPLRPGDPLDLPPVPAHGCAVYRLTPASAGRAAVLRTNGHFSMGGAEIRELRETEAGVTVGLRWPWRCELHVEVAVPRPIEPAEGPPAVTARAGGGEGTVAHIRVRGPFEGEARLAYAGGS